RTALAQLNVSRGHTKTRLNSTAYKSNLWNKFTEKEADIISGNWSQQIDCENRERNKQTKWPIRGEAATSGRVHAGFASPQNLGNRREERAQTGGAWSQNLRRTAKVLEPGTCRSFRQIRS